MGMIDEGLVLVNMISLLILHQFRTITTLAIRLSETVDSQLYVSSVDGRSTKNSRARDSTKIIDMP